MIVETLDGCCGLLEADVVETSKGSAADVFDCVVWDKKLLLPSHEDKVTVLEVFVVKVVRVKAFRVLIKCLELAPVLAVNILIRVPLPGEKGTFLTDDLPSKESSQGGIFLSKPLDLEISAQVRVLHRYMLEDNFDVVRVAFALLVSAELRAAVQE